MSEDEDTCGSTDTSSGDPCQNPAGSCPWHDPEEEAPETGRPTKLTHSRQENIALMIEEGHSLAAAARSNDITVQSFFNWMERGADQEEGIFADFFQRITRARGHGESKYVDAIIAIAKENDDTSTLMSLLKSRYPNSWADVETGQAGEEKVHIHFEPDETTKVD